MYKNFYTCVTIVVTCVIIFLCQTPLVYAKVQKDFYITAQDILNARPKAPEVNLTPKMAHELDVMEKRHFNNKNVYDSNKYRVAKLENVLLGRTWEYLPIEDRMRKLKLASQRKMLRGTPISPSLRRAGFTPQRIANDSTPVLEDDDDVGIIDGLMKLYAPDAYDIYNKRKKRMSERYENW